MYKIILSIIFTISLTVLLSGFFTRIESGEVGLRVNASREVQGTELMPGSWNQTLIGDVLEFPVRDIPINIENKKPITSESVALDDLDLFAVYSINPNCVSDLWITKSRAFHTEGKEGTFLMFNYMLNVVNNAVYEAVRKHPALQVTDKRPLIEEDVKNRVAASIKNDKLENCLTLSTVQIRAIVPPRSILDSAAAVVRSQNELAVKENEVKIAEAEARRMQALSQNSQASIEYMDAQARLNISEGVKQGKVQTIVVPADFKGIISTAK